jgi:hypothetical protein
MYSLYECKYRAFKFNQNIELHHESITRNLTIDGCIDADFICKLNKLFRNIESLKLEVSFNSEETEPIEKLNFPNLESFEIRNYGDN